MQSPIRNGQPGCIRSAAIVVFRYICPYITMLMEEFSLVTPTLLFSAVSLIMLAYTNRFLSYAQLVRRLKDEYLANHSSVTAAQIANLRRRLHLTRLMQLLCITSLLLCVVSMLLTFLGFKTPAVVIFGVALFLLICSLCLSVAELLISTKALELHLNDLEKP